VQEFLGNLHLHDTISLIEPIDDKEDSVFAF